MSLALARLLVYVGLVAAAYYYTYLDVASGTYLDDLWTEAPQEASLFIGGLAAAVVAYRRRAWRVLFAAIAGLAFASLFREFNNQIAESLGKGSWLYFSLAVAIPVAIYVLRNVREFWRQLDALADSFAFGVYACGMLVLHVFSRLYGANPLWRAAMGGDFDRTIARISEEGIELLAYTLVLLGTLELCGVALRRDQVLSARDLARLESEATTRRAASR